MGPNGGLGRNRTSNGSCVPDLQSGVGHMPIPTTNPMVLMEGFEPSTSCVSDKCSNQLSYTSKNRPVLSVIDYHSIALFLL